MRRRALALLLCGLFAVPAVPAAVADPTPSPTTEPENPIRVVLVSLVPRAPRPGDPIEITGTLRNVGSRTVTDLRVRLQIGDPITTRGGLHAADTDRPPTSFRLSARPNKTTLRPGAATTFDIRTSVQTLELGSLGVYPLDIVARGNAGDGIDSLGLSPTWVPFFRDTPSPTRVAVLWPLVDVPHLKPNGSLANDDLASSLGRNGRLGRLLDTARGALVPSCEPAPHLSNGKLGVKQKRCDPVPVTYAVDPDLLDTVVTMSTPYEVGKKSGKGTSDAVSWLDTLRASAASNGVLALPYGDPDVTALARDPSTKDDIANAEALGTSVVEHVLNTSPLSSVAWPPAGPVSAAAADALALGGANAFVLDESAYLDTGTVPDKEPGTRSVFTTSATGRTLGGLVVDSDLSNLLTSTDQDGVRALEQRFLAETAIIAAEEPSVTRTLLLAPDRRTTVTYATVEDLRDLGRVPWLCPVRLSDVVDGTESCPRESGPPRTKDQVNRGVVRTDTQGELAPSYLAAVRADRDIATQLTDAVLSPDPAASDTVAKLKSELRKAVARAESSAGRDEAGVAQASSGWLHDTIRQLMGEVLVRGGRSLLTSSKGTLSVSLENTLAAPVQVSVRFTSKTATLTNAQTGLLTVEPGHAIPASVKADTHRSGQFLVFAQIVDRNGKPFGPEAQLVVRSTRFGRLALAVTFAAFGVLMVAAGFRIVRRARAARE